MVAEEVEVKADRDQMREQLERICVQLHLVYAGLIVAACSLRSNTVEHNAEIARVLEFILAVKVNNQIESVAELIADLTPVPESTEDEEATSDEQDCTSLQ